MQEPPLHVVLVKGWIRKDNEFLIALRGSKEEHASGDWSVPGGKVELVESDNLIETTLKQEILEEVGIQVKDKMYLFYTNGFIRSSGHHVVNLSFICEYDSGEIQALEDTDEVRWAGIEEIKKVFPKYLKSEILALEKTIA